MTPLLSYNVTFWVPLGVWGSSETTSFVFIRRMVLFLSTMAKNMPAIMFGITRQRNAYWAAFRKILRGVSPPWLIIPTSSPLTVNAV